MKPVVSSSRALRVLSGQLGLQKSVGREVQGGCVPKGVSEAREARKVEAQRSRRQHKGKRGQEAMSRAREAQCRGGQAARRKVNSLNPFLL